MTIDTTRLRSIANSAIGNGGAIVATPEEVLALLDALDDANRNVCDFGDMWDKEKSMRICLKNLVFEIAEDVGVSKSQDGWVNDMDIFGAISKLKQIEAAARNLAKVKGRHNSELAMNQLIEACK